MASRSFTGDASDEEDEEDNYNTDEERQEQTAHKKRKVKYVQKFRNEWLQNKDFKNWLKPPSKGSTKPTCSVCSATVQCSKSGLERHSKSVSHIRQSTDASSQKSVGDLFQSDNRNYSLLTESRISAFVAEHNLPFSISQPLVDLIKATSPTNAMEGQKLKQLTMSAIKCTNVVRQGLGLYFSRDLINRLRETKFSIIPDETTDVSTEKQLAICVSYFDFEKCEVMYSFYDMVSVDKCDAQSLYDAIRHSFQVRKIPLDNIIGFSSDTCNVMFGEHQSVTSLMKADLPHIVFVRCNCHMIHLCVSHACLKLSTSLEDLCRNVYTHFSRSSLRMHELEEFQDFVNVSPHKLLSVGQTRWLSLEACVNRLLEQWDALKLYFTAVITEKRDPSYVTESIYQNMSNPFIKAQLQFLQVQLHRTNEFNKLFQSEKPMLQDLHAHVKNLLSEIMSDFINLNHVRNSNPFTIDIHDVKLRVPIKQVYLGIHATETLSQQPTCSDTEGIKKLKQSCQAFLIELVEQVRSRFRTDSFKMLEFLKPENALGRNPSSLVEVFAALPYLDSMCDKGAADIEWRRLSLDCQFKEEKDAAEFWKKQLLLKNEVGEPKFPNLKKVVACTLSLPHSNACVERLFSHLRRIKTDIRSSLKSTSLVSLLHIKNGLRNKGISSHQLTADRQLLLDLRKVKSNATDEEVKNILSKQFE